VLNRRGGPQQVISFGPPGPYFHIPVLWFFVLFWLNYFVFIVLWYVLFCCLYCRVSLIVLPPGRSNISNAYFSFFGTQKWKQERA
jgi:hypothetical protein